MTDEELNQQLTEYSTANDRLEDENAVLQDRVTTLERELLAATDRSEDLVDVITEAYTTLGRML